MNFKSPIVLIVFKRPKETKRILDIIRGIKPSKLFIIADGARFHIPDEEAKCLAVRKIVEQVDWDCEVYRNYSSVNQGCGKRIHTGLDWVFDQVEEAIILEDDCIPNPTFFRFCDEMLKYYCNNERISSITGYNSQFGKKKTSYSYYFSHFKHPWGWATWRRAWQHFDYNMEAWPEVKRNNFLSQVFRHPKAIQYWTKVFQQQYEGQNGDSVWDYQWAFSCWLRQSLGIVSEINLISNIGYGEDSTHFKSFYDRDNPLLNTPTFEISFPLKHPPSIKRNIKADDFIQFSRFTPSLFHRFKARLKKLFSEIF